MITWGGLFGLRLVRRVLGAQTRIETLELDAVVNAANQQLAPGAGVVAMIEAASSGIRSL